MAKKEKPKAKTTSTKKRTVKSKPVSKLKFFTYTFKDGKEYSMTEQQKKFCDAYLAFGAKGVDAVYEAGYKPKNVNVAYSISSENLRKPEIFNYINSKYEEFGFNDEDVLKEHLFLIKQQGDLGSKARGIDMYYKKTGGYAEEKHEHVIRNYSDLPDDKLQEVYNAKTNKGTKK